jgi:hypothetical protein
LLEELQLCTVLSVGVVDGVQISLEISEGKFIGRLEFAVVLVVFLYCVVGEVYEFVVEVFHVELLGGCSDVAVLVPVALLIAVDAADADVGADVELPLLVEEGHDVLLDDVGARTALFVDGVRPDNGLYLFDAFHHLDSGASVGVLAGFDQPGVAAFGFEPLHWLVLYLFVLVGNGVSSSLELFLKLAELLIV